MSAESPREGLRLLALLIAADLREGSPALAEEPPAEDRVAPPRRGRRPTAVVAIAARPSIARAA